MRRSLIGVAAVLLVSMVLAAVPVQAASSFADPVFQAQWQQGESITPNFWGPLANAKDGQREPYAQSGQVGRLVQYFDKGRMELCAAPFNCATSPVTSGLLATDLIKGQIQIGDVEFQQKPSPAIPVAGDPDGRGPTYAAISANTTTLLAFMNAAPGAPTTRSLNGTGTLGTYTGPYASDPLGTIAAFDTITQHNVPAAFATYRTKVGVSTIGLAISEPFWSNVKVAGQQKDVLVQAFERRVLTYTPTNPTAFQVEFGNIGQHYYQWRYGAAAGAATPVATQATTTIPPVATPIPSPTATPPTAAVSALTFTSVKGAAPGNAASVAILGPPATQCSITYTTPAGTVSGAKGLTPQTTTSAGLAVWSWLIGGNTKPGTGTVAVQCGTLAGTTPIKIG